MFPIGTLFIVKISSLLLWSPIRVLLSEGDVVILVKSETSTLHYFLTRFGVIGRIVGKESWERWFRLLSE